MRKKEKKMRRRSEQVTCSCLSVTHQLNLPTLAHRNFPSGLMKTGLREETKEEENEEVESGKG